MSLFGDLDLDDPSIPDDPNLIPDNTYEAFVYEVKPHPAKNGKPGIKFTYKISEGPLSGRQVIEWKSTDKTDEKSRAYLKQRLVSLGVSPEEMGKVDADSLVGTAVYVTVKNKDGFANVNRVSLNADDSFNEKVDPTNPFGI